jgi:manganese/iron transport system permease protein
MLETLLQPFQISFMQNAFLIAVLLALPAALVSCYLVLKSWALMGDAISHAVLPGIVMAYVVNLPLALGAFAAGMACAFATGYIADNSRIKRDTVMGVVFSGMFGLGIVLITWVKPDVHLDHILFGNILGVSTGDMAMTVAISLTVIVAIALFWRDLLLEAFDSVQARALGLPVRLLHYGLLAMIAASVVAALKSVGIILAIALLIAPGATALLVTKRFEHMMAVAACAALISAVAGVYLSFFIDSAPAPTIVLIMTLFFIAAFIKARQKVAAPITV